MFFILAFSLFSSNTITLIRKQLNQKQFNEAFQAADSQIIHKGINKADNVLFFLRGYASIKLGNYNQGISDLSHFLSSDKIINKNDKLESYSLRSTAYLKTGKIEEALNDALKSQDESLIKISTRANLLHITATSNESSPRFSLSKYVELIKICPFSEDFLRNAANIALSIGDNALFIEYSQKALEISPKGKILEIIGRYHFTQLEFKKAEEYAKKCTKSLSDSSNCKTMLKSISEFQKNEKKAANLVSKKKYDQAKKFIEICQSIVKKYSSFEDSPLANQINKINVKVLIAKDEKEEAIECLNGLIKAYPNINEFLVQRGQLLLDFNDYSGAISDFQIVKKRTKPDSLENKEVVKFIEKASELQEKEKNMNYYTIMGLKSNANLNDIKNAYRKLVVMWHPDRFNKPLKKKEAEKKMMMINKAYDVLSDETKKKLYDFDIEYDKNTKTYSQKRQPNKNSKNINKNTKNNKYKFGRAKSKLINEFKDMGTEYKDEEVELFNIGNEIQKIKNELKNKENEINNVENVLKIRKNENKKMGNELKNSNNKRFLFF